MNLTDRQLATVLAALRYWQRTSMVRDTAEDDIATNGGELEPLIDSEIDDLCEALNVEETARV